MHMFSEYSITPSETYGLPIYKPCARLSCRQPLSEQALGNLTQKVIKRKD